MKSSEAPRFRAATNGPLSDGAQCGARLHSLATHANDRTRGKGVGHHRRVKCSRLQGRVREGGSGRELHGFCAASVRPCALPRHSSGSRRTKKWRGDGLGNRLCKIFSFIFLQHLEFPLLQPVRGTASPPPLPLHLLIPSCQPGPVSLRAHKHTALCQH